MRVADRQFFDNFSQALSRKEPPAPPAIFKGERNRIEAGMAVYRNNVRASLSRALGERFPVIQKLVGEAFFKFLANEYFHAHPPSSPLIARYGDALPAFLESFAPARDHPYLADAARLEIAWLDAYHAAEAAPVAAAEIIAVADGAFEALRLSLHPSLRLVSSPFPIATIWRRNREDETDEKICLSEGEHVLIARPRREVLVHSLAPGAYAAITVLRDGGAIAGALAAGVDADAGFSPQGFFEQLFRLEIIIGATPTATQETTQ